MGPIMDHVSRGQGGLVHLWSKSGMQIMVLLSFGMQVFLLTFGSIRRRSSSAILRLSLWLGYLLADSTAIYALGHLSVGSGGDSSEHQLVSFWAPFLLLHLGGPDNMTAYALEDNQLWQRHLQILVVQVVAAAYVTYKSMASGGTLLLLLASISMFVVGLAKYGERIWALKCSRISNIRSNLRYDEIEDPCESVAHDMSDEEILSVAHRSLDICKAAFTDFPVKFRGGDNNGFGRPTRDSVLRQYKLVEMELSLMYDALYTKAVVIHTRYGFCIHIISVLGTATAFFLFHLHLTTRTSGSNGYNAGDVIVSYILLVGALVLEATSVCKALVSSWTRSLLKNYSHRAHAYAWDWLLRALDFVGPRVQPARIRRWQGSIGQYNLFHLCTRDSNKLGCRLAKKMGWLEDWWNKLHFTTTFQPTDEFKLLVHEAAPLAYNCDRRGITILKQKGLLESFQLHQQIFGKDFNESILVWSIVTENCIHEAKRYISSLGLPSRSREEQEKVIQAIEVLSNYLMFLLVVKPEMLPNPRPQKAQADVCRAWDNTWSSLHHGGDVERNSSAASQQKCWNPLNVLKGQYFQRLNELFHHDDPNASSRIEQREKLVSYVLNGGRYDEKATNYSAGNIYSKLEPSGTEETNYCPANIRSKALQIWEALAHKTGFSDTLELMLGVWAEMLVYAAENGSRDSHARSLTDNGGEFITIIWLMVKHDTRRRGVVVAKVPELFQPQVSEPMIKLEVPLVMAKMTESEEVMSEAEPNVLPVRLDYRPPFSSIFISEEINTSNQSPTSQQYFFSEANQHQPPATNQLSSHSCELNVPFPMMEATYQPNQSCCIM